MLIADARVGGRVSRAGSKVKDETGVGECQEERSNRQRMLEMVNMEAWDTLMVDEVLVFCGGVNMARADAGDVGSRRAVGKERIF